MDIVTSDPIQTATLCWRPRSDLWALTLVCKATFHLVPGVTELSDQQEDLNADDYYWNDDPSRSLSAPTDLVPYKLRADVLLVGHAFAPRGEPARSVVARLFVAGVDKSIEAWADRSWGPDGALRDGPRLARFPLRYDRAGGGPETTNPVGMRPDAVDPYGVIAIPNLQPVDLHLTQRGSFVPPVGFGPIAPTWPGRIEKVPGHAYEWARASRYDYPVPDGINARFFNAAPEDQQVVIIRPDERIVLENLHHEHARLVTSLPGALPRAIVERPGVGPEEMNLVCDTLWIDTDRAICTLVWRGQIAVPHPDAQGRISVGLIRMGAAAWGGGSPSALLDLDANTQTMAGPLKFDGGGSSAALPFQRKGAAAPPPPPPQPPQTPRAPEPSLPAVPAPYAPQPPPLSFTPPPPQATPAAPQSPWALGASKPLGEPPPRVAFSGEPSPRPAFPGEPPPRVAFPGEPSPDVALPSLNDTMMGIGGSGAVNAIAVVERAKRAAAAESAGATREAPVAAPGREALTLLWLDTAKAPAIVISPRWVKLLSEPTTPDKPEPPPKEEEDPDYFVVKGEEEDEDDEPEEVKQRRWVSKILSRGEPTTAAGLVEAMVSATTKDGTLAPPIVLVSGDLSFPYDPWEMVKVLVIAATPAASADKKLKDLLDGVQEAARLPGIERSVSVAEGLIARIREGFAQSNTKLGPGFLDAQAERMLLEGRCYQKRALFGQTFLRCFLHMPPGEDVPTYLPEALSKELPLLPRMRARLIVEVHGQQDHYETHRLALRALSVGRLITLDPQPSGSPPAR